ncbi:sensor histidine kinase [Streptococcus anginosus]|uniref:sensor histidine kinase n=1 Tax=Streptococcus anginosus TaxID=1328 RepID=UPI000C7BC10A|nr:sensor histidine kinase [Streptococcus anginosus]KAA9272336.1 HAMP domain-containing histidine kinase [Streptococcus anginosus]MCW0929393.1 sensor histidine kinase [Streptococcus anginosus]MCW0933283.1 sensor histidine kinase [Streptococcus anginosus]MCW0950671.1 sensor histidine kinase [Streptococcus anginosus]MCW0998602.1 sensor histidine kinase [Streptococcus anginosus]
MEHQNKHLFFKYYLRSRKLLCSLLFIFYSLLFIFSYLFEDERTVLQYVIILLLLTSLIGLILDFVKQYQNFRHAVLYGESDAYTPLEALLTSRIRTLEKDKKELKIQHQEKQSNLLDYYTLWVHQIKTPIAASKLLVQDLQEQTFKNQLEQELFKIDSYTNLVLQYLRLESFHDDLVVEKENIEDLVKEVVKKYTLFFIQQGLSLNLHDLNHTVITDKKWFLVILEQVLSNSLKYTKQGSIEIFFQEDTLHMKDTGLGIQNSDLLRVFERGFSGYNGRLTHQSSGLGLYLSKKIADKLGHELHLHSVVGEGTTVMITFKEKKLLFE